MGGEVEGSMGCPSARGSQVEGSMVLLRLEVVVSEKWSLNRFVALHVHSGYHPQTDHGPAGDSA